MVRLNTAASVNLGNIKQNLIQIDHHIKNICCYISVNKIPKGLKIKVTPQTPGIKTNNFYRRGDFFFFYRVHEHLFGQKFKPLESNDDSAEFRGLLERLTTTLDFLFSAFLFLLKCCVHSGAYSFYPNGLAEWDTLKTVLRMATTG
jgi:hypothetical protein